MSSIFRNLFANGGQPPGKLTHIEPLLNKDEDPSSSQVYEGVNENQSSQMPNRIKNKIQLLYMYESEKSVPFYVFEPKGFKELAASFLQNMFEMFIVISCVGLAMWRPSFVSGLFLILTQDLLICTNYEAPKRLKNGRIILFINIAILVIWTSYKFNVLVNGTQPVSIADESSFHQTASINQAMGFRMGKNLQTLTFEIQRLDSFLFEGLLMCIFLIAQYIYSSLLQRLAIMKKVKLNVIMTKNYEENNEDGVLSEGDSDEYEQEIDIGIQQLTKDEQKNQYELKMKEISKSFKRIFIHSNTFYSRISIGFFIVVSTQIMTSMAFNGALDIPILIFLLVILAIYAIRKKFYVFYQGLLIFVMYFIYLATTLKITYLVLTKIDFIQYYMKQNEDLPWIFYCQIIFGLKFSSKLAIGKTIGNKQMYEALLIVTLFFGQLFKQCIQREIQNYLSNDEFETLWWSQKLNLYLLRKSEYKEKLQIINLNKDKQTDDNATKKGKKKTQTFFRTFKNDLDLFLPTLNLWVARILITFQAYMYHNSFSLVHLAWVLFSFTFPIKFLMFISVIIMLPLYSMEFVMIYGNRIPKLQDIQFFKNYGKNFNWTMESSILEQSLYFLIMTNFFIMISCIKLTFATDQNQYFIQKYDDLIKDAKSSNIWRFLFFVLKNIQKLVLIMLFVNGSGNLNTFTNLGFMFFFAVYTTQESLYRKTSKLLVFFISLIIFGQYFYSLQYHMFTSDNIARKRFEWLGFFDPNNPPDWKQGSSIYFRNMPLFFPWFVLILMSILNTVNILFQDEQTALNLQKACYERLRNDYQDYYFTYIRVKNGIAKISIFAVLGLMLYYLTKSQTSAFSSILFFLNVLNIGFIAKSDGKKSTLEHSQRISNWIKNTASIMFTLEICFLAFIGESPKPTQPNSLDQKFLRNFPKTYSNLSYIGVRIQREEGISDQLWETESKILMKFKFYSLVAYLIVGIYLNNYFDSQIKDTQNEQNFKEEDFQKLLDFDLKHECDVDNGTQQNHDTEKRTTQNKSSKFVKKDSYDYLDFLDHYESRRYTTAFMVYKKINWWPTIDIFATYGHFFTNFIIIYVALHLNVSLFMGFNVICVCMFYTISVLKLQKRSQKNHRLSGLLSQTDIMNANMITKQFKIAANYEFLRVRKNIWRFQIIVTIIAAAIGFPTTLLIKQRMHLELHGTPEQIEKIDYYQFWFFITGILKDYGQDRQNTFYFTFGLLLIALSLEKQSINWLTNRWGCTYNKLQKFVELDMRKKCLEEKWDKFPKYDIQLYKNHYFYKDMDTFLDKFTESHADADQQRKNSYKESNEVRDFIPYKIAVRIQELIVFTVRLEGRDTSLNIDKQTSDKLEELNVNLKEEKNRNCSSGIIQEYESFQILKDYKINFFEKIIKEAVDSKYRISLFKGIQIVLETVILLDLMLSVCMKANIYSIVYLLFIIRYVTIQAKTQILVHLCVCISLSFILQYFCYMLNLTVETSPARFPADFKNYPLNSSGEGELGIKYAIPLFFNIPTFHDLRLDYFLGIGVEPCQIQNLKLDFVNLFLVSMYILNFRNPILVKSLTKVFWEFPTATSSIQQIKRVDPNVWSQIKWQMKPSSINSPQFKHIKNAIQVKKGKGEQMLKNAEEEYQFQQKFVTKKLSLNEVLISYIDMKYQTIWSNEFCKQIKWQFKEQSMYFRLVKQGSILCYMTQHIFTITLILFLAVIRQSFLSMGYVAILVPYLQEAAQVLKQRLLSQDKTIIELREKKEIIDQWIIDYHNSHNAEGDADEEYSQLNFEKKSAELIKIKTLLQFELSKLKLVKKSNDQKLDEKLKAKEKDWGVIRMISVYLLTYAFIDFSIQIFCQQPMVEFQSYFKYFGLRKIWNDNKDMAWDYQWLITLGTNGLSLRYGNLRLQVLNCLMISLIALQTQVFKSAGYQKFITQKDGSMDLLVQLSEMKAKSISFVYNNNKISKIYSIQRQKEQINATLIELKQKIQRWRRFTRTTLHDSKKVEDPIFPDKIDQLRSPLLEGSQNVNKIVRFEDEHDKSEIFEDNDVNDDQIAQQENQFNFAKIVSRNASEIIRHQLAKEFVQTKLAKLNILSKLYLWLNQSFTTQILFKNKQEVVQELLQKHAKGEVNTPTELETIMFEEAIDKIDEVYNNKQGLNDLSVLIETKKQHPKHSLLNMAQPISKLKLKDFQRTWEFTRTKSMLLKLLETMFYIIISNTHNLIYVCGIFSMYQNAGIFGLVYPLSIFGYALLEETRPRRWYWNFLQKYTIGLLIIKFIINLSVLGVILENPTFMLVNGYLKIGIYNHSEIGAIFMYMLPEILLIALTSLNEIHLRLLGLHYQQEDDIEPIQEGIDRNILKGDEEQLKFKKQLGTNMIMAQLFHPLKYQIIMERVANEELKKQADQEQEEKEISPPEDIMLSLEVRQNNAITSLSKLMCAQSTKFDIDDHPANTHSDLDRMVSENEIQKVLENDNLIFIEGHVKPNNPDFIDSEEKLQDADDDLQYDVISAGDYPDEFEDKMDVIHRRNLPKYGLFERSQYFGKLFPSFKIQKPGYDLYARTTLFLAILAIFVFMNYGLMSVDQDQYLQNSNNGIFKGDMVICLLIVIFVIILERFVSRSDTKEEDKQVDISKPKEYFNKAEFFGRSSTKRSMTVKLQTMRTADLDIQGNNADDFLKNISSENDGNQNVNQARTKITTQQKTKYFMHMTILIVTHIFCFWFLPIQGNVKLYGSPICDLRYELSYGCKNFQKNGYLKKFYFILCIYLLLSAQQIRHGLPIHKRASSILQYNHNPLATIGALVYQAIPFIVEIRCLLDFTFSKTALDIFQFWQLWQYHFDLYCAKNGNWSYVSKTLGSPTLMMDKCVFGVLITGIILTLLVGPLYFFSDIGGFVAINPVESAFVGFSFIITKNMSQSMFKRSMSLEMPQQFDSLNLEQLSTNSSDRIYSKVPYDIFYSSNPYFRNYSQSHYEQSSMNNWTETRFFGPNQLQDCIMSEYSDNQWLINEDSKIQLKRDLIHTMNLTDQQFEFSLGTNLKFTRALPPTAKTAKNMFETQLDFTRQNDCRTRQQLIEFAQFDCKNPANIGKNVTIQFSQIYNKNLILGSSTTIDPIYRNETTARNQMHDLRLINTCQMYGQSSWLIEGSSNTTVYTESQEKVMQMNPLTCEPLSDKDIIASAQGQRMSSRVINNLREQVDKSNSEIVWERVKITLLSMLVSASFFASFNISSFYFSVSFIIGGKVRIIFIYYTFMAWMYEITHPDAIIKLIEAVYMKRHELDLIGEEECYRMLQEIVRQPELLKSLTGSSLKGTIDPIYDNLDKDQRQKLEQLEEFQRKGFDVQKLRETLLEKHTH